MTLRLSDLVEAARDTTRRHRYSIGESELRADAEALGARARAGRFRRALEGPGVSVIAEVKGTSPIAGSLRDPFDPVDIAARYERGGAAAVSVLTEEHFFAGSIEHLLAVSSSIELPTLRKDFVVEPYQIFRAATAGASAVLLIAELLDGSALAEFVHAAHSVGLDALVEFHRPDLLLPAVGSGSGIVGVNNRDLDTMEIDSEHALRLASELPNNIVTVAESAISSSADVRRVAEAGFGAILVGTALVTAEDPQAALEELVEAGQAVATDRARDDVDNNAEPDHARRDGDDDDAAPGLDFNKAILL